MRRLYLIAYDISDNSVRRKIEQRLCQVGLRVQYSVFECLLNESGLNALRADLRSLLDVSSDRVHYYVLCEHCKGKRLYQGPGHLPEWKSHDLIQ